MKLSDREVCGTCRWFMPHVRFPEHGNCYRYPPLVTGEGDAVRPYVKQDTLECGEHENAE